MLELAFTNTVLSRYISNPYVYHCPADYYIDPKSRTVHARSVSMNSAIGTIYWSSFQGQGSPQLGIPVAGGWLGGSSYDLCISRNSNTCWLTYGKMSSFTQPGPANTFVLIDENPYSINDGSFAAPAAATSTGGYIVDFPSSNHNLGATMAFADGHALVHAWRDPDTYNPAASVEPGLGSQASFASPNNPDCVYLASVTSAPR
jgi:prepilin-type processing-associated H-X9-DG protein